MIDALITFIMNQPMFVSFIDEMHIRIRSVDWATMIKVVSVMFVTMVMICLLIVLNEKLYDKVMKGRVKTHHLTIRNNGNSDSVYLLHTVDLPKTLAVRFRIDGNPMIWVSLDTGKAQESEKDAAKAQNAGMAESGAKSVQTESNNNQNPVSELVPDLKDPLKPIQAVTKAAADVGKKAGFFASIFSTLSVLLPKTPAFVKDAQSSLKGIQQDTNSLVGQINTKTNAVSTLGDQMSKLPGADKVSGMTKSAGVETAEMAKSAMAGGPQPVADPDEQSREAGNAIEGKLNIGQNFVYDEELWMKNIGREDEKGGALNYAQSKVLAPGESMKIDIEIMNLSESTSAISQLYKIEVVQVPQISMHLSSVRRMLNGIVVFDKVSEVSRVLPAAISFIMIIAAVQLVAGYTYLLF